MEVMSFADELNRKNEELEQSLIQLSRKNRYEAIIIAVTRSIHKSINLQEVLENAVDTISRHIDTVDNVSIYLVEEKEAVLKSYRGYPDWWIRRVRRIPYPQGFTWKTIIEGKPTYCADADSDMVIGLAGREMGTKSYASMPIHFGSKTVGTININSLKKNAFDEDELKLLEIVAQQIETAINNAQQAEALRKSEEALRKAKDELEIKVEKRTAELRKTNEKLLAEITERKRTEKELKNSREQLRALATHLQSVREEERRQIAREVHDELGQALTGLKIDLSWLGGRLSQSDVKARRPSILEKIQSMSKFIDATIQTVRRIATQLRPGVLDDLGLVAAIEWQAQDFQKRTGIRCKFIRSAEDISLDQERSTVVFRIFQETITNIARHAKATRVSTRLKKDDGNIMLEVEDNGRGITEEEIHDSKSLGLLGMRESSTFRRRGQYCGLPGKRNDSLCAHFAWEIDAMIKILIVDDHPIVRHGLKQIVSEEPNMVVAGEAQNGKEAIEFIRKQDCDVVMLDITMPDKSGLEVLKQIKKERLKLPVIILSVHSEEQYALRVLKSGAAGYMTKESAPDELVKAIRKVVSGGKYLSSSLAERLAFDLESKEGPLHETLSNREFQVMCMIASGKTVKEIAYDLFLSVKTVSTYRVRILEKMKMKTNAKLTYYAVKNGLLD
jgi:DNA-binding NarL/FixJ family response regulator/signal transduction histidine kinase